MIRAILIDLDDTLLDNSMDVFLPAYFQKLGSYLSDRVDPERMLTELLAGTRFMLENLDPNQTLEQAFASHFYPALGFDEAPLRGRIETFYREVFPELEALTSERPQAIPFVARLAQDGRDICLATNPLFPYLAVEERLRWAGFTEPKESFRLITTYERFHFTKPHPEYYAEILSHLGVAPFEALMIGDDPERDLAPARSLGMGVFHLASQPEVGYDGGDFSAAHTWIEQDLSKAMRENAKTSEAILARARGSLAAMQIMLLALNKESYAITPISGEWSLAEIMCHMRDVELEVHLDRLDRILKDNNPLLVGEDTDMWAEIRQYHCQPGMEAFQRFISHRMQLIERMDSLTEEDWSRPALHTLLGPMKLNEVMAIANDHDTIHLAQLRKTLQAMSI